ncbi:OmpH family outer membrane protein [uncultured Brachyspira sp.]|uniref:OmpH family outer membrane protein n=1 Tax=uncultured Brachyspira sp. TaxID=221953 RepID=UPI002614304B|nr:OmpH family outer membrane protein [uncultured Brachyspira sp.]
MIIIKERTIITPNSDTLFMKKSLVILGLFFTSIFSGKLYSKGQGAIAVLDMDKIVENTSSIRTTREKLEEEKKVFENSIREKERSLQEEQEDIESKASILSPAKLQQRRDEFQKKVIEFQREASEKNSKLQARFNKFLEKLKNEVGLVLKNDKYKIYSIILNSAFVIHNNSAADITPEVIKDLNKKKITLD